MLANPKLPRLDYYLINAFETGKPGSGNQASVVIFPTSSDPRAEDDGFLLRTAQDFGFAETAYLVPLKPEEGRWGLRWFTTEVEVPICGHATLAAARVVLSLRKDLPHVTFETRFWGELVAKRVQDVDEEHTEIEISLSTLEESALQKIRDESPSTTEELREPLAQILGIKPDQVVGVGEYFFVKKSLIIELSSEVDLASLKVEPKDLVPHSGGLTIITQMVPDESSPGTLRTNTRVFFLGYMEDPVTGAAHAFITGYYLLTPASARIPHNVINGQEVKSIKLDGKQLSRRGGKLRMELADGGMVRLAGAAVEWGKGSLTG